MKKKFVVAVLLAGTLSMSSVAYASGGVSLGEVTTSSIGDAESVTAENPEAAPVESAEEPTETAADVTVENAEETTETAAGVTMESVETTTEAAETAAEEAAESLYMESDAVDLTQEELLTKLKEAAAGVTSVKSELIMDMVISIGVSGDESSTGMQMDMTMNANMANEEIFEPYASHQTSTMVMSVLGQTEKQVSEVYIRDENGEQAKYEGTADESGQVTDWERSTTSGESSEFLFSSENMGDLENEMELTLKDQKVVDAAGTEYYVLESNVNLNDALEEAGMQEELNDLISSLNDLGNVELPESVMVELYVNAEDFLPSELTIDMSGLKGNMGETAGEGTNTDMEFQTMVISYRCSQYNAISEIAYPSDLPAEGDVTETPVPLDDEETESDYGIAEAGEEAGEKVGAPELGSEAGDLLENAADSLAEELGVKGIQETTDTSVSFTDKGTKANPAGLNEMGKAYIYNAKSDQYEQVGVQVTGITGGEEAAKYVDELLNAENSYYSFSALKNYEEYRIVDYDLYLTSDFSDDEYGTYAPNAMMNVVGKDEDWLTYKDQSYYAAAYGVYEDTASYHPGDTVHCQYILVMPKDMTEYELEFGPYGLDYFYVAIS